MTQGLFSVSSQGEAFAIERRKKLFQAGSGTMEHQQENSSSNSY